jgi:hypothetical protein
MTALGARGLRSLDEAQDRIAELVQDCKDGISDLEQEAMEIAQAWDLDEDWVMTSFAEARLAAKLAKKLEAPKAKPAFISPPVSPTQNVAEKPKPADALAAAIAANAKPSATPTPSVAPPSPSLKDRFNRSFATPIVAPMEPPKPIDPPKAEPEPIKKPIDLAEIKRIAHLKKTRPTPETNRPSDLVALPGVCGEIQDYFLRTAMKPSAALSLAPAIIVPSTLISGKIVGPTGPKGCSSHLYIMALGRTTSGKQHVADVAKECLNVIKADCLIGPNRFKSAQGMMLFIKENKVSLCVQDEYGPFLAKLSDPRAMTCEREISERLRECWGLGPNSIYNTSAGATEKSVTLQGVHLNLLALGVRDEFYVACRDIQVANGLLNRKLIIEEPGTPLDNDNPSTEEFPFKLMENLAKLRDLKPRKLTWEAGAREIYEEIKLGLRKMEDETQANLFSRDPEKYVRICNAFASAQFSSTITRSDGELAYKLVDASGKFFKQGLEDASAKRLMDHQDLVREIEKRLVTKFNGEATVFQIKQAFKNNKKHKNAVSDALTDMLDSGTLSSVEVSTGGRPKTVLRLINGTEENGQEL